MAVNDIETVAREKLGPMRLLVRGELRRTRESVRPGERVLGMAIAARGLKSRLIVATDQRFLVVCTKRCEELPYPSVVSVTVDQTIPGNAAELLVATGSMSRRFVIAPPGRAVELASAAAPGLGSEKVSTKGGVPAMAAGSHRSGGSRKAAAALLSIVACLLGAQLVLGSLFDNGSDGDRRRAPVFAAGGCTNLDGIVVSCDDNGVYFKLVARPAGARRCGSESRTSALVMSRDVTRRLHDRRLCLHVFIEGEE